MPDNSKLQFGITMRVSEETSYQETRDALDERWGNYMAEAFPGSHWMPIPNLGRDVMEFVRHWSLNAIILTGGNDLGENENRDITERGVLDFARQNTFPVIGICRGMQLIIDAFGGDVVSVNPKKHVGKFHEITFSNDLPYSISGPRPAQTNSFHSHGVIESGVPEDFQILAHTDDGSVELVLAKNEPILGMMWHPEREFENREWNIALLREHVWAFA